jgi:hypothetical protein
MRGAREGMASTGPAFRKGTSGHVEHFENAKGAMFDQRRAGFSPPTRKKNIKQ